MCEYKVRCTLNYAGDLVERVIPGEPMPQLVRVMMKDSDASENQEEMRRVLEKCVATTVLGRNDHFGLPKGQVTISANVQSWQKA